MSISIDERIARCIVKAQVGSDSGKYLYDRTGAKNRIKRGAERYGYDAKTKYIIDALKLINTNKPGMFNYYIMRSGDQNGYDSLITYFNFKINNKQYQISFHTPYDQAPDYMIDLIGKGMKTHWRKSPDSIESTRELVKYFKI